MSDKSKIKGKEITLIFINEANVLPMNVIKNMINKEFLLEEIKHKNLLDSFDAVRKLNPLNL